MTITGIFRCLCISAFLAVGPLMAAVHQPQDFSKVLGDWTGESICVGNNPSCHDEKVIYHFSRSQADPQKLTLAADKIVNGKPEPMGELEFTYDAAKQSLTGEFQNARYHGLWEFKIKGDTMEGTLTLLPEKTIGRRVKVERKDAKQQQESTMTNHATGTFEVKLAPQDDKSVDKSMGRMTIDKQWQGELEGTSSGQMLTGGDAAKGSAGYVAMEKFTGTLKGRKGSFILQHSATMTKGEGQLTITVVPDSGAGELAGISGKLSIKIESGKHSYDLEYNFKE